RWATVPDFLPVAHWLDPQAAPADVVTELLHEVIDPELGINIVALGLVYGVQVEDETAHTTMTLTTPGLPAPRSAAGRDRGLPVGCSRGGAGRGPDRVGPALAPEKMSAAAKHALGWDR